MQADLLRFLNQTTTKINQNDMASFSNVSNRKQNTNNPTTGSSTSCESSSEDDLPRALPASPPSRKLTLAELQHKVQDVKTNSEKFVAAIKTDIRLAEKTVNMQQMQRLKRVIGEDNSTCDKLEQSDTTMDKCLKDTNALRDKVRSTLDKSQSLIDYLKDMGQKLPEELVLDLMEVVIFACGSLDVIRDKRPDSLEVLKNIEYQEYKDANPHPDIETLRKKINKVLPSTQEQQGKLGEVLAEYQNREAELRGKITSLQSKKHSFEKKVDNLEGDRTYVKNQTLELRAELADVTQKNSEKEFQLKDQKSIQENLESTNAEIQSASDLLQQEFDQFKVDNDELVNGLNGQLDKEKAKCRELQTEARVVEELQDQVDSLKSELTRETRAREDTESIAVTNQQRALDTEKNSDAMAQERIDLDERLRLANERI